MRWSINVDRQTEIDLRTHLAQRGKKKADLSKSVEQALKWRLICQTMIDVQKRFSHMSSEEMDALVGEAVAWARLPEEGGRQRKRRS